MIGYFQNGYNTILSLSVRLRYKYNDNDNDKKNYGLIWF